MLVGPSGVGKSTLLKDYISGDAPLFKFSVSYATRKRRENEIDGVHYHFISNEEFLKMEKEGAFIESFKVHDTYKGSSKQVVQDIMSSGKIPVFDIDIQGAKKVYEVFPHSNFISVLPPSLTSLEERLK